ncbi:hypothetical protein BCR44DRAFT_1495621 [Catenaria anguillulae PL171]|uniref:Uncharacterized protein n=1 Tax=Catenaria anguillulae PL171 TaxID=765915 RepID=A0A1Y2I474_9FUNG|nr:hypothetical protein BCR44DRAFT_1495621 [Catenaria anguillulae PL171]
MSDRILKQQLAGLMKKASSSSAPIAAAKPTMKIPVVKKGIGRVKKRIRTNHKKDRADLGLVAGGAKARGIYDKEKKTVVPVGEEGILGTYEEDKVVQSEQTYAKNAEYFSLGSLSDAFTLTKRSRLHGYRAKETSAKAKVLESLAKSQAPKPLYRDNKTKVIPYTTLGGKSKVRFAKAGTRHNPEDDVGDDDW